MELKIIQGYLPKQISVEELESIAKRIITETGAASSKDFEKVMPVTMKELKGRVDGRVVKETVKKILGN